MASGKASVAFRFELPDGTAVIAETSLALLTTAADALRAIAEADRYDGGGSRR